MTDNNDEDDDSSSATHTICAVVVLLQVHHWYAVVDPLTPETVMDAAAAIVKRVQPETALLFLCREYGKFPNILGCCRIGDKLVLFF